MSMTNQNSGQRDEGMVGSSPISSTKETGKASGAESCPDTVFGKGSNAAPASGGYKPESGYAKE